MEKKGSKVKISQFVTPHPTYECIMPLRLCYMMCNSERWKQFAKLESHCEQRKGTFKYEADRRSVAQFLQRFYKLDMTEEQILTACGIIQVNGHEVVTTEPSHVAVYADASLLEHNCVPTCCKTFTATGEIIIYAVAPILQGTNLSISYTDTLWGTITRQHHLSETKFFSCHCLRCEDPSELGTYYSALSCRHRDCSGSVLPSNFSNEELPWICDGCGDVVQAKDVAILLDKIGQDIVTLAQKDVSASKQFLNKWEPFIHKNHYYLTQVRIGLAQRYGEDGIQKISESMLNDKLKLCKELLELLAKVAPGEFRLLGLLNFQLYLAMNESGRRECDHQGILLEIQRRLEDCVRYLEHEPESLPEGKLRRYAQQAQLMWQ